MSGIKQEFRLTRVRKSWVSERDKRYSEYKMNVFTSTSFSTGDMIERGMRLRKS